MGFTADRLLQVRLDARAAGYDAKDVGALHRLLLERVSAIPGVRSTASVDGRLMHGTSTSMAIPLPGLVQRDREMWDAIGVGLQFFETMDIELVRGRTFTAADFSVTSFQRLPRSLDPDGWPSSCGRNGPFIINEAFVKRYYRTPIH